MNHKFLFTPWCLVSIPATAWQRAVDTFNAEAEKWTASAKDGRWKRPYTELTYQPMQEVLSYLRANGFKTYIVTGGRPGFRAGVFPNASTASPRSKVVGTAAGTKYSYDQDGKPILDKRTEAPPQRQRRRQARGHSPHDRPPPGRRVWQLHR